jgi:hypothetical protein
MCTLVQVCDAVHARAHKELFCIGPLTHQQRERKTAKELENTKSQIAI